MTRAEKGAIGIIFDIYLLYFLCRCLGGNRIFKLKYGQKKFVLDNFSEKFISKSNFHNIIFQERFLIQSSTITWSISLFDKGGKDMKVLKFLYLNRLV
jgi:hypothetical protein